MDYLGKTLGNYRIDRLLGEGGMGAVYQAYDLTLRREVAIKLIHPHFARRPEFRERFIQEAQIMARLDHPGIVKVYALGKEGDLLFLPMEFIKGGNLRQMLDKLIQELKWIPVNESLLLVQQLCQVVDYAHEHGVLHRDIKPANLMLKPEPTNGLAFRVILTDLGLAKLVEGLGITAERTSMGTPAYMSPEQASSQPADRRSDVYSLAVLLYELTVGRLPFQINTITEAVRYHTQIPPPSPRSFRPELSEALEKVILKALEKAPNDRYPTAASLGNVLAGLASTPTEIVDQAKQEGVSLTTKYQESIIAPLQVASASLMTMFEKEAVEPRGSSVFGGESIAPSGRARVQVVEKEKTAKVLTLPSGTVIIGRDTTNHVVLDDIKVSRKHAQITWDGMEYHVMDLDSSNGTFLDNTKLLPGVAEVWRPRQILRIGDAWLRLIPPAPDAQSIGKSQGSSSRSLYLNSTAGLVSVLVTPQQLVIEAGGSATATVSLLNQSAEVDHFSLSLTGIPNRWVASLPSTVQLMPGEQKETAFTLQVPRTPDSEAGQYEMTLKVSSERNPSESVDVKLVLSVGAYSQFEGELQPQRLRTGQLGSLRIANQGNHLEKFTIHLQDAAHELTFQPPQLEVEVPAGESVEKKFQAQPRETRWVGAGKIHPFSASIGQAKGARQTLHGEMLSRGLIPVWVPPFALLLCLALIGGAGLFYRQGKSAQQATLTSVGQSSDLDGDGLIFSEEISFDCNPNNRDSDNDSLPDGQERDLGTNCRVQDSDHDNLTDGEEVNIKNTNPANPDTDGDGLQDNVDPNPRLLPTSTLTLTIGPSLTPVTPGVTQNTSAAGAQNVANLTNTQKPPQATASETKIAPTITPPPRLSEIDQKYSSLGGGGSFLGAPTGPEQNTPDGRGRFRTFEGGSIYWTPSTGAWEVHGSIRDKWASLDWEKGVLGYPLTDEVTTPDGIGRFNHFEFGSIYWTPNTGAWEVHGAIRDKWASLGWERSCLGYPISDEEPSNEGWTAQSRFEHGRIRWSPDRGAREFCG